MEYILSCESTADLSREVLKEKDLSFICFHFSIGGEDHPDDMGASMPLDEFYRRMKEGEMTKTSQIGIMEYLEYFRKFLEEGKDVLHISLSSGISGSYNSAMVAAEQLWEEYPDRQLLVVDSLAASSGYGMMMSCLAKMRDAGASITELRDWVEEHKLEFVHWFFTADLTYLIRGGRVSRTAGQLGMLLNICPLMHVDTKGTLQVKEKIRTKKKVMKAAVEHMKMEAENGTDYTGECYISQAACREDAEELAEMIENNFPKMDGKVRIFDIGTTIGSHTGPGLIALFFKSGEDRKD